MALHDIADRNVIHLTNLRQFIGLYETSLQKCNKGRLLVLSPA